MYNYKLIAITYLSYNQHIGTDEYILPHVKHFECQDFPSAFFSSLKNTRSEHLGHLGAPPAPPTFTLFTW